MSDDKLIRQHFTSDCAVACMAMFLGVTYEDIVRHVSGYELTLNGLTNFREVEIAKMFKVQIEFLDRTMLRRDRPAVLTVPSLNARGDSAPAQAEAVAG